MAVWTAAVPSPGSSGAGQSGRVCSGPGCPAGRTQAWDSGPAGRSRVKRSLVPGTLYHLLPAQIQGTAHILSLCFLICHTWEKKKKTELRWKEMIQFKHLCHFKSSISIWSLCCRMAEGQWWWTKRRFREWSARATISPRRRKEVGSLFDKCTLTLVWKAHLPSKTCKNTACILQFDSLWDLKLWG